MLPTRKPLVFLLASQVTRLLALDESTLRTGDDMCRGFLNASCGFGRAICRHLSDLADGRPSRTRECCTSPFCQRVDHRQLGEAREIPVRGPESTHAVKKAKGGNPGIVYERTLQEGWLGDALECVEVAFTFGEESAGETRKEALYGIQGNVHRGGISEDAGIGSDREKFVDTGPRNTDGLRARDCLGQHVASAFIEGHLRAMRMDEYVRIDGDHAPCSR